jgi:hypothetical protein
MTAGDFTPTLPRRCRVCGFRGEWSGLMLPCPDCRRAA